MVSEINFKFLLIKSKEVYSKKYIKVVRVEKKKMNTAEHKVK